VGEGEEVVDARSVDHAGGPMSQIEKSRPAEKGKMVIFTAAAAPSLEEAGMMDAPTFTEEGANEEVVSGDFAERSMEGSRLTVPFRQAGPDGFSLVDIEFAPGFLLPRHSHSSDCLYYIVAGSVVMGQRELGPGDGFFLPAEQPYAYRAGPDGVKLLEFRHQASFDMKIYEKDMVRYRAKAEASLAETSSGGAASAGGGRGA
jgi:quercetin dioxygenase-like cupin family protein